MKLGTKYWCSGIVGGWDRCSASGGQQWHLHVIQNPGVLPPNSHAFGMTYNEWSAKWWQWAVNIPAPNSQSPIRLELIVP